MAENEAVDVDRTKATPLEAAEPVEVPAIFGATFAERAAANADRFKKTVSAKKVDDDAAENKAVKSSATKSRTKKKS